MSDFKELKEYKREDQVTLYLIREKNDQRTYQRSEQNEYFPFSNSIQIFKKQERSLVPQNRPIYQQRQKDYSIDNSFLNLSDQKMNRSQQKINHSMLNGGASIKIETEQIKPQNKVLENLYEQNEEDEKQNIVHYQQNPQNKKQIKCKIQEIHYSNQYQENQKKIQLLSPQESKLRVENKKVNPEFLSNRRRENIPIVNQYQRQVPNHIDHEHSIRQSHKQQNSNNPQINQDQQIPRQQQRPQQQENQYVQQTLQERNSLRDKVFSKQNLTLALATTTLIVSGKQIQDKLSNYCKDKKIQQLKQSNEKIVEQKGFFTSKKTLSKRQHIKDQAKNNALILGVGAVVNTIKDVYVDHKPWKQSAKDYLKNSSKYLICSAIGKQMLKNVTGGRIVGNYLGGVASTYVKRQNFGKVYDKVKNVARRN